MPGAEEAQTISRMETQGNQFPELKLLRYKLQQKLILPPLHPATSI